MAVKIGRNKRRKSMSEVGNGRGTKMAGVRCFEHFFLRFSKNHRKDSGDLASVIIIKIFIDISQLQSMFLCLGDKVGYMMIKTSNNLLSLLCIKPGPGSGVLFEWMK